MKLNYPKGATPLNPDETTGLIPSYVNTQSELNELEGRNIEDAVEWIFRRKKTNILNVSFVLELHKRMFNQVWKWAGFPRNSEKNIGVLKEQINSRLHQLLKNVEFWIKKNTYPWDEIGARFHHGLVSIHVFPNGNGRHARLMTDILLETNGQKPFSWGRKKTSDPIEIEGPIRKAYIDALKHADSGKLEPLLEFVRS